MRVLLGIFLGFCCVTLFLLMQEDARRTELAGVQAVKFSQSEWTTRITKPGEDAEVDVAIKTPNLFNCASGVFDCDGDMCVWVCELNKGKPLVQEEEEEFGGDEYVVPERRPGPNGAMPKMPLPDFEMDELEGKPDGAMPTCETLDADGNFDCSSDI